jgi:hypothetical protein
METFSRKNQGYHWFQWIGLRCLRENCTGNWLVFFSRRGKPSTPPMCVGGHPILVECNTLDHG